MTTIFEKYNLNKIINASGKMTALGVSKYLDEVLEAQIIAGQNFFEMDKLFVNVGKYLANLIGAEDAQIVSSASAGIAQSVAALIGRGNRYHLHNPYSQKFSEREVVIPKAHNIDYGVPMQTMIELGGGKVIEAGYANLCTPNLIETQITEDTIAILYVKSHYVDQKNILSIQEALTIARKHKVPLILDAAAEQDLTKYINKGVDLVIYSGAKAFEGPSSGIVLGSEQYISWIRLQSKGIGRAMKVGKENVLGLAAAIEQYLQAGPETGEKMKQRLLPFIKQLNGIPGITANMVQDSAGREIYRAKVTFDKSTKLNAREVANQLKTGSPVIYVRDYQVNNNFLEIDIRSVNNLEIEKIIKKLNSIMVL